MAGEIAAITAEGSVHGNLTERCIGILRVVREQLNLEVVFVGQFVDGNRVFRHISSKTADALIRRMPCLVPDVTSVRVANGLPDYYHGMGAHIGVPVRFSDGTLYGVLCGFSFEPRAELGERDVKRLEMAANATARLLAQAEGLQ